MFAPSRSPRNFREILEIIWWKLDCAVDLEIIRASARLGALECLEAGCTAVVDHHESPNAIEGSLSVIAEAAEEVGVRVRCAYGVTDRHGADGARAGLAEGERYLRAGGRGYVGVHAAFTCSDESLEAAAGLAEDLGVGVHLHVAEGPPDSGAAARLASLSRDNWLLVHGVCLPDPVELAGTLVHNPRSNLNNSVGYARPRRFGKVVLGTDGIGGDMLDEFRLAYLCLRGEDVTASPTEAWAWLANGWELFPEALSDLVTWSYSPMDPWHLAFTPGVRPLRVERDGETLWEDGRPTRVDASEVRAKAGEQARRLHRRIAEMG